jgi:predicted Zn-dependent protease
MAEALAALGTPESRAAAEQVQAGVLRAQGRVAESDSILAALAETEAGGTARTALAMSAARDGRLDEAEALTAEIIAEAPDDLRARLLAAELRLMRRDVAGAEARLREAVAAAPAAPAGYVAQARLALALGRPEEAERVLRDALDPVGDDTSIRFMLAQLAESRGDFETAIAEYETLYESRSDSAVLANNFASLLAEHRAEDPEALRRAEQIARRLRASDEPHFRDTYGWILFLNGDTAEAARYLSEAAAALPNNPIVRYHAGRVYAELGRAEQAREHLQAALALDPAFPKADSAEQALESLPAPGSSGEPTPAPGAVVQ